MVTMNVEERRYASKGSELSNLRIPTIEITTAPPILRGNVTSPYVLATYVGGTLRLSGLVSYFLIYDISSSEYAYNFSNAPSFVYLYKGGQTLTVLLSPGQAVYVGGSQVSYNPNFVTLTSRERVPKEYWDLEDNP